jgi:hypothetical protein
MTETQTQTEPVVFYSRSGHFILQVKKPRRIMQDGQATLVDEKIIEFSPQGDGYGRFVTNDPEVISALEKNPNVLTPQRYQEETTPPEVRFQMERDEKTRLLTSNNDLLELLHKQDAELAALRAEKSQSKPGK